MSSAQGRAHTGSRLISRRAEARQTAPPPRLAVLLARKSPFALVLRRGPSRNVACILWNRADDSFRLGQWLRGSISDAVRPSPDGNHWVYFAYNGKMRTETGGAWTAVARAPYLKAVSGGKGDAGPDGGGPLRVRSGFSPQRRVRHEVLREDQQIRRLPAELSPLASTAGKIPASTSCVSSGMVGP